MILICGRGKRSQMTNPPFDAKRLALLYSRYRSRAVQTSRISQGYPGNDGEVVSRLGSLPSFTKGYKPRDRPVFRIPLMLMVIQDHDGFPIWTFITSNSAESFW